VERLLCLLSPASVQALKSPAFDEAAKATFATQGATLGGSALATAVVQALQPVDNLHQVMTDEFQETSGISNAIAAFSQSRGRPELVLVTDACASFLASRCKGCGRRDLCFVHGVHRRMIVLAASSQHCVQEARNFASREPADSDKHQTGLLYALETSGSCELQGTIASGLWLLGSYANHLHSKETEQALRIVNLSSRPAFGTQLAYRIHCYFETSVLSTKHEGCAIRTGRPKVVFVLGGPGSGKGTQCARISQTFGYKHLSAGDLLREERNRHGSQYGELIEGYIKEGKIVPVEITVKLIQQAMESSWEDGKFLIDGFPRSFDNMEGWENVLGGKVDVKFALFFDCSEACMEARIMDKKNQKKMVDDNAEAVKKRFRTFQQESLPVVELLQSRGLLRKVSSEKSVEEVWEDVRGIFGPSVVFVLGGPGKCQGTVCERITENFGYTHLSAGDLLREERARPGSKYGELIESHIKEGKLVPADITVKLLQQAMELHCWEGGKYLIDGFPRSFDNLESWDRNIKDQVLVKFILYMDCSSGVMEARLLERGKTSGRADDNIESIKKRFVTFHKESTPVVEKFAKEGKVKRIDAEQSRDVVWSKVQAHFGPSVVFVLGGPGAGKGTQCQRISDMFSYKHLSAGDLLREERNRPGSEYGDLINSYIKDGKIVPVDITVSLLQKAMMTMGWEGGRYLIDGFPRSFDNLEGWYRVIGNKVRVKSVLFFDVSEPVMEARLLERGKTSGRVDDNLESIRKRFITFQQESMPVVEKFRSEGLLRFINAEQSEEMVWNDVRKNFGPSAIFVLGGPGAGKGTQCTRIAAAFGFSHLSAGDLLREERARPGSQLGELISSNIKEGKLVPVEITVQLLQKAMEERGWEDGKYLIDGFPRSFANMEGWNKILADKVDVKCCLFFGCTEAEMEACCTGENSRKQHLAQRNQC
ncbi:unnamed protein product, partial [Polarella glacialis]